MNVQLAQTCGFAWIFVVAAAGAVAAEEFVHVSDAKPDANGFLIHEVHSSYESGTTQIRVLLPDKIESDRKYPVMYVLPVEAGTESFYGDGLKEIQQKDLHNKYSVICVAPTFSHLPWYADHPTNPEIRQESYFLKVVVPEIEKRYPVQTEASGRLLLGFSKSGWGAFCLLLRNPDLFGKAAAWDAPVMMNKPGLYGSGPIFGGEKNFEKYRVTKLLTENADKLRNDKRLILLSYGNFKREHQQFEELMTELKIPHIYRAEPFRKHDWHSGWVEEAVNCLFEKEPAQK